MADVSTFEVLGVRIGKLGTSADLSIAAALSDGDPSVDAHTDANRIGFYFDRTGGSEKVGVVIMGTDALGFFAGKIEIAGNEAWHAGNFNPNDYQLLSEKGAANGYASLDGTGKVPASQLPLTGLNFKGNWDANANSPTLSSGSGTDGDWYNVSVAGTTNLDGITDWDVGDKAIFVESVWQKIDNSDESKVLASAGDATPGFLDAKVDGTTIQVTGDQLAVIESGLTVGADQVTTNTASFGGILSGADTDVQLALDTIDDHTHALDDLSDVVNTGNVVVNDAGLTTVDSVSTGTTWLWLLDINDGTVHTGYQVLAAATGASAVEYTIHPATRIDGSTIVVNRAAGTTTLEVQTADPSVDTARARRMTL